MLNQKENTMAIPEDVRQNMSAERLKGLLPHWLKHLQQRIEAREFSRYTLKGNKMAVSLFLSWLGEQQPTPDVLLAWKIALLNKGDSVSTVNTYLSAVRSFFHWLVASGHILFNPAQTIRGPRRMGRSLRHIRQPLTDDEVCSVLVQPDRETIKGKRDYAMLMLMVYTGVRSIEVLRADISDLQRRSGKLVLLVQGKGHIEKDAVVVLLGAVETAMSDWLAVRGNDPGALFISLSNNHQKGRLSHIGLWRNIKRYFVRAGVHDKNKTVHSLRHTAITNAIRRGAPAAKVLRMSRHATLASLMIYYHETDRIDDPAEQYIDYGA
jgi:site-specific recombinase XerD